MQAQWEIDRDIDRECDEFFLWIQRNGRADMHNGMYEKFKRRCMRFLDAVEEIQDRRNIRSVEEDNADNC